MIYDYYASLGNQKSCPKQINESGLCSGFVDGCTVWACQKKDEKDEARKCYIERAKVKTLQIPTFLKFKPDFAHLPDPSWIGIEVKFTLNRAWHSKDDRPFHVLDNPVRKDRVFGVPFMSAASWKGLLRWSCRMTAKPSLKDNLDNWNDPAWIVHLFGNEKGETETFNRGALVFYPTWFNKVGFEVINPHDRERRAGTQPIYYEVVPAESVGLLQLLYAPSPNETTQIGISRSEILNNLVDAIKDLLEEYGVSAKRTVGWGSAKIENWKWFNGKGQFNGDTVAQFKEEMDKQVGSGGSQ
ncbi:MAG: RAMP superfamily CRISPR-associated protein [Candidatus Magnetoovum sp. WYHC-5]|nr:RAMP superfamily CRISPR-associated protein [Candidatus Magnetoovum sp. WYHC-5]